MLRDARTTADMTQQDLAESLGVAVRTVGNWERGPMVPPKYWIQVRNLFPSLISDETRRAFAEEMTIGRNRARNQLNTNDGYDRMIAILDTAVASIDLADNAAKVGVHPLAVIDLVQATVNIVIESGAVSLPLPDGRSVSEAVINRGVAIAQRAVDEFVPDGRRGYALELAAPRAQLREKEQNVGAPVQDDMHAADLREDFDLAASDDATAVDPDREP